MRHMTKSRAAAVVLLATTFALAPILAEARPGVRGGASTSIRSSGGMRSGGGGGFSGARSSGGGYGGGASASTRQSRGGNERGSYERGGYDRDGASSRSSGGRQAGAGSGDRMANNSGNRVNNGNVNSGNRVNNGNVNTGNRVNTGNINTGNVNVNVDNGGGWNDYRHPVAGAVAIGAVAGATAAIVAGSRYYALPSGCSPYPYGGYSYYHCGDAYYETRYEGDKVVYVVVDEPG